MKRKGMPIMVIDLAFLVLSAQAQWTPAKRLTWTSGNSGHPAIAAGSSGQVHLVWADYWDGNFEICHKKSTDGGSNWTATKRLTWTEKDSKGPSLDIDSLGHLHVVWWDATPGNYELYYKRSTDGGANWTANKRLTWTSGDSYGPQIAVDDSDYLHIVWYDVTTGTGQIYHKKSSDGGDTWSTNKRLTWTSDYSGQPAIALGASGHLHVVWDKSLPGDREVYYKKSTDGGGTWTTSRRLTWNTGNSAETDIAVDPSGYLHLVWCDYTPGVYPEIYYKKGTGGGSTWTPSQRLTWISGTSSLPAVAVTSSGHVYVVWEDRTSGNIEIYYKKSTDGGADWTASKRLTWTPSYSEDVAIATASLSDVHVVWADEAPGNYEIYYKRTK